MKRILVTGAGGFIGRHLAQHLHAQGNFVRAADIKFDQDSYERCFDERMEMDLRSWNNCLEATEGMDRVYNLAANMGGIGFITKIGAEIMHDNSLININMLEASKRNKVDRYLFSSSACVYPEEKQDQPNITSLKETDALPADPDTYYGWEKLYSEKMCEAYLRDHNLPVRIARYHNIYGPNGTYNGGREKSIAALCRKVAEATNPGTITLWGDGKQTRSFCYIDDAVRGTVMLMESDYSEPVNIGSDRQVTVDDVADIIIRESGKTITKTYDPTAPQGVRGRNADITIAKRAIGWEPAVSLEEGIHRTYNWIQGRCNGGKEILVMPKTAVA